MKEQNLNKSILKFLENLELAGITFIRDYIQFLFDGPFLNTYTLPQVKVENKNITSADFGYHDTLCSLIGKKITIKFEGDIEFLVSLKSEDRNGVEAAMLQLETDGKWNVW
jgi:hypothetical protein